MNRSSPDHQSLMKYLSRARRVSKAGATRERETVQEDESTITAMEHMKRARERMTSSSVGMIENFFETTAHESAVKNAFRRFQEAQVGDSVYEQMDQYATEVDIVSLLFHEHDERHRAASTIQIAFRYFMMRRGKMTRALLKEPSKARYMETREEREARRKLVADLRARQEVILSDKTKSEREKLQHLLNHQLLIASYKTRLMEERQRLEQEAEEAKRRKWEEERAAREREREKRRLAKQQERAEYMKQFRFSMTEDQGQSSMKLRSEGSSKKRIFESQDSVISVDEEPSRAGFLKQTKSRKLIDERNERLETEGNADDATIVEELAETPIDKARKALRGMKIDQPSSVDALENGRDLLRKMIMGDSWDSNLLNGDSAATARSIRVIADRLSDEIVKKRSAATLAPSGSNDDAHAVHQLKMDRALFKSLEASVLALDAVECALRQNAVGAERDEDEDDEIMGLVLDAEETIQQLVEMARCDEAMTKKENAASAEVEDEEELLEQEVMMSSQKTQIGAELNAIQKEIFKILEIELLEDNTAAGLSSFVDEAGVSATPIVASPLAMAGTTHNGTQTSKLSVVELSSPDVPDGACNERKERLDKVSDPGIKKAENRVPPSSFKAGDSLFKDVAPPPPPDDEVEENAQVEGAETRGSMKMSDLNSLDMEKQYPEHQSFRDPASRLPSAQIPLSSDPPQTPPTLLKGIQDEKGDGFVAMPNLENAFSSPAVMSEPLALSDAVSSPAVMSEPLALSDDTLLVASGKPFPLQDVPQENVKGATRKTPSAPPSLLHDVQEVMTHGFIAKSNPQIAALSTVVKPEPPALSDLLAEYGKQAPLSIQEAISASSDVFTEQSPNNLYPLIKSNTSSTPHVSGAGHGRQSPSLGTKLRCSSSATPPLTLNPPPLAFTSSPVPSPSTHGFFGSRSTVNPARSSNPSFSGSSRLHQDASLLSPSYRSSSSYQPISPSSSTLLHDKALGSSGRSQPSRPSQPSQPSQPSSYNDKGTMEEKVNDRRSLPSIREKQKTGRSGSTVLQQIMDDLRSRGTEKRRISEMGASELTAPPSYRTSDASFIAPPRSSRTSLA